MRALVIGTGPSLTVEALRLIRQSDLPKFGCNNVYQVCQLDALLACNHEWWDHYWPQDARLRAGSFTKWTWHKPTADKYGINYIRGEWGDGLSTDPEYIHYGHSSGYQLLNLATAVYGVTEAILIGYDLRYPEGYDGHKKHAGGKRHYFGEYPEPLQHWTKFDMEGGKLGGLLKCYGTIHPEDYGIRIINCSPGTALDFFETGDLKDYV